MSAPRRVTRTEAEPPLEVRRAIPQPPDAETLARWERWREENREAIEAYNAFIEREGLPLAEFRKF